MAKESQTNDLKSLSLTINGKHYEHFEQYITGAEVRKLGNLNGDDEIFLAVKKPWDDEHVSNDSRIDLARPGIEHFYTKEHMVEIFVNKKPHKISRGKHSVSEIKQIGGVAQSDELAELVDQKLIPLANDAIIPIKGCEQFFSHKKDGSSS